MKPILKLFCTAIFISLASSFSMAQNDRTAAVAAATDQYVISAKAGGVNYVEGSVNITRKDGTSGRLLRRDEINIGDRVSTGVDGRAEILLNPGSYMRVGSNTNFEFKSTSLENLQIILDSGSSIFEVYASRDFAVRVTTPKAKVLLVESGVFRVDALPNGETRLAVWEGRALVDDNAATLVTKGKAAVIKDGSTSVAKITKDDQDELAAWSKSRGKDLAKQTANLKNQTVRNSLLSSFNRGGWGMYNSFGLWVFDPFWGGYSFLPFGYGWYSPYGYGLHSHIGVFHLPQTIYNPPVHNGPPEPTDTRGGPRIFSVNAATPIPPFEQIKGPVVRSLSGPTMVEGPSDTRRDSGNYSPGVQSMPAPVSAPVTSAPATVSPSTSPGPTDTGPAPRSPIKPMSSNFQPANEKSSSKSFSSHVSKHTPSKTPKSKPARTSRPSPSTRKDHAKV